MKKSEETKIMFLEQLRKTPIVQIACEKLGVGRATFYRWKQEDGEFAKQVDAAIFDGRLMVNDLAESQLIGAVKDRDMRAIVYWLRNHHSAYKAKLELEGSVQLIQELSDEQKKLVRDALRLANVTLGKFDEASKDDYETDTEL